MATMFPAEISTFLTDGEEVTYQFLHNTARPDNLFFVWYSPDIEDREPDFILFAPDCGVIVLEVKDWLVDQILQVDPKNVTLNINGKPEVRKNPLAQAREYVGAVLSLLSKHVSQLPDGKPKLPFPVTWGVVLPHIGREEFLASGLGKVIDANRVLCWDEMNAQSPYCEDESGRTFRQWLEEHFPPQFAFTFSAHELDWLRNLIFPIVRINLPKRAGTESAQNEAIRALDHEQENLARTFGPGRRLISGPSGSGKTLILAHQAWHLPRTSKSIKRILVTCFNLSLVGYIRRLLACRSVSMGPDGVEVIPFYSLCERILGEKVSHHEKDSDYYALIVQEALERLDGTHPLQNHWDAILVDEGQDFSADMANIVLRLLPARGTLVVAEDENQSLYSGTGWENLPVAGMKKYRLQRQYRNSRQIARLASRLFMDDTPELAGAEGKAPNWLKCKDMTTLVREVAHAVAELVRQGVPMSEIAVLYTHSRPEGMKEELPCALQNALEERGVMALWASQDERSKYRFDITIDSVTISTIHSTKGLDFAHVFLLGLELLSPERERDRHLAYVGITRARETLTLGVCRDAGMAGMLRKNQ